TVSRVSASGRRCCVRRWRTPGCVRARTRASTVRTTRRSPVGPGRTDTMSRLLVVNAGSTSLKLSVVDDDGTSTNVPSLPEAPADVDAVVHRVVHGGRRFRDPVVVDGDVLKELQKLVEL